jgi:hypothetical protein
MDISAWISAADIRQIHYLGHSTVEPIPATTNIGMNAVHHKWQLSTSCLLKPSNIERTITSPYRVDKRLVPNIMLKQAPQQARASAGPHRERQ